MSFGKQGGSDLRQLVKPVTPAKASKGGSLDAGFMALTLGVVAISAGGAFAASSVISWAGSFSSAPVRPIPTVIAGLDRDAVKAALANEAFPDKQGRAFMGSLASKLPEDHDRLLDKLADSAMAGAERDGLVLAMNEWSADFAVSHLDAIGRTGAQGFNKALDLGKEALGQVETAAGGCDVNTLQSLGESPEKLLSSTSYGGGFYKFNMRANQSLVDLIVAGRDAPAVTATLEPEDERALQTVLFSLMQDPQVMSLMKMSMSGAIDQSAMASKIDVCALARVAIVKLKDLPDGTKARVWAMGANQLGTAIKSGNLSRLNPAQLSMR